ncbi:MAG: acyl-ACP--UDP-N-acetylglucosamine O-acyltransferase [Gammaproteobacteria bacterium]|nr:acyl-ACP--UDP-N-acetylglucosamine O-acyltransferase [Gammaproteobacteria bacterium]
MIDPRAIIDPSARIGAGVSIGPWSVIDADVEVGDECVIDAHVIVRGPTRLGRGNRIYPFASLGDATPALAYGGEPTWLVVGDHNVFREGVTVHRGTEQDRGETTIGSHNLFMAYAHVAHDCVIGDHCTFANNASASGHVAVGDWAILGGYAGVPQFRSVGAHAMVAGMSLVLKDVPAFVTVAGHPARVVGLNREGLRRRGFGAEAVANLRAAYRLLYQSGLRTAQALERIEAMPDPEGQLAILTRSVQASRQGIARPRWGRDHDD